MDSAAKFTGGEGSAHDRYLKLFQYIRRRDKELGEIFDNVRRSTAYMDIALAVRKRVLTRTELQAFSEETQAVVRLMLGEQDA